MEEIGKKSARPGNGYSGLSMDDLEAAQTLEGLRSAQSPGADQAMSPPPFSATNDSSQTEQTEPLLYLITRQYPLAGAAITGSISAYSAGKIFPPFRYGAELFERTVGSPVAGTIGSVSRRTGVESGLRWALNRGGNSAQPGSTPGASSDIERANLASPENLPPYDQGGRSPSYQEKYNPDSTRSTQSPQPLQPGLIQRVSGLGIAMREESRKVLSGCLQWLLWADGQLDSTLKALETTLKEWEEQKTQNLPQSPEATEMKNQQQNVVLAKIKSLNAFVVETFAAAEGVVRKCANQALPANARELVLGYMNSLPYRHWAASSEARVEEGTDEAGSSARQAIILAQQGLGVVRQVNGVVNTTLIEAEKWCQRLGRSSTREPEQQHPPAKEPSLFSNQNFDTTEKAGLQGIQPTADHQTAPIVESLPDVKMEDVDEKR
ncbi:MAG: hypothetical protein Q9227_009175 [Pyrenula ochraceoflavens]